MRALNASLVRDHGLTVNDYEALLLLADAPHGRLRRTDLARELMLSPSGVTRLLDGLERAGLVEKAACPRDARVTYAVLTGEGRDRLAQASCAHVAAIEELFAAQFTTDEVEQLGALLGRLPAACATPPPPETGGRSTRRQPRRRSLPRSP